MSRTPFTLEHLLCSAQGFGLTTASPLQRAICRIVDGLPLGELAERDDVRAALGGEDAIAALPAERPAEVLLLAAIRCGKSMLAAATAVRASQTCDVSGLAPGEVPRVSVLSLSVDLAGVVLGHLKGTILARPALRALLVDEPTADAVLLRHPSGRPVEIKVVAGAKAGASLVARWSAGAIFDEAPRMSGADDAVVNLDDARRAVLGRLLEGAQIISVGSPFAPFGPVYDAVQASFGKPTRDLVVIRAPGPAMNPSKWTPEACERLREQDAQAYATDVECEFADPSSSLLSLAEIKAATRPGPTELAPNHRGFYLGAMDPGFRADWWAFVLFHMLDGKIRIVLVRWWKPTDGPLNPSEVLGAIKRICSHYGESIPVYTDQLAADAIISLAQLWHLRVVSRAWSATNKTQSAELLKTSIATGRLELCPVPEVERQLLGIRKKVNQNGSVSITFPRNGSGHGDLASAIMLGLDFAAVAEANATARERSDRRAEAVGDVIRERFGREPNVVRADGSTFTPMSRAERAAREWSISVSGKSSRFYGR